MYCLAVLSAGFQDCARFESGQRVTLEPASTSKSDCAQSLPCVWFSDEEFAREESEGLNSG